MLAESKVELNRRETVRASTVSASRAAALKVSTKAEGDGAAVVGGSLASRWTR